MVSGQASVSWNAYHKYLFLQCMCPVTSWLRLCGFNSRHHPRTKPWRAFFAEFALPGVCHECSTNLACLPFLNLDKFISNKICLVQWEAQGLTPRLSLRKRFWHNKPSWPPFLRTMQRRFQDDMFMYDLEFHQVMHCNVTTSWYLSLVNLNQRIIHSKEPMEYPMIQI